MNVVIDGITYVPRAEVPELTDERLQGVLEVLTSMRYFGQDHKMMAHAWEAIEALPPELAKLEPGEAFTRVHGTEEGEE